MRVLIINGPNLNRLGRRRPDVYGTATLEQVIDEASEVAATLGIDVAHVQSNHEGELVDWLHDHQDEADAAVINPAGLTEVGHPLRDALADSELDVVVVHISNPAARPEPWRRTDIFAPIARTVIAGAGTYGYQAALHSLHLAAGADGLEERS
jgi:3-dehydroquinate dehydratase-2